MIYDSLKRIFDLIASVLALVVFSPLLLVLFFIVYFGLGRPVLFKQKRPGINGHPFLMFKLRTMTEKRDSRGNLLPDSDRLTPLGVKLRALSLDELPALINVVKGDLSLVGPRPLLMQYNDRYNPEQKRRLTVKPGITGWAQINGRNAISWEEKFKLDVWYVDHRSFWLDLKILILTVKKVFLKDGISAQGHVTMPEFMGSKSTKAE